MNVVGADSGVSANPVSEVASSAILALYLEPLDRRRMEATGLANAPDGLRTLSVHTWPGNVRELPRPAIWNHGRPQCLAAADVERTREVLEREMVQDARRRHRGKITATALERDVSRPTLYELVKKRNIGDEP